MVVRSVVGAIRAIAIAIACSGCLITAIATTKHEVLNEETLDTRESKRPADVGGTQCYVDKRVRVTKRPHVDSLFGAGGAGSAIVFGLLAPSPGNAVWAVPLALDGVASAIYFLANKKRTTKSTEWQQTLDTRYCNIPARVASSEVTASGAVVRLRGPASRDSDGDGLNDDVDSCTLGLEDLDGYRDDDGCPDLDNDGDGLADSADRCANGAEDRDGFQDEDGCADLDNDGDGVADTSDTCVSEPEDRDGFQDGDGCIDRDNDGDGLHDVADKCPNEAEDKDTVKDDDGCVDADDDADGVVDTADKCREQVETKNGYLDEDGCADEVPAKLKRIVGVIPNIKFADTGELAPGATGGLDRIAKVLAEFPDVRIAVELHADDKLAVDPLGKQDAAAVAKARAESVKAHLVKRGIDGARVVAVGFADHPKQTRVELALVSNLVAARQP